MNIPRICIIGGGASGMIAAIVAKRNGASVTILERNSRIGKKILATGNGRCNYTNVFACGNDYNNPDFVEYALSHFSPNKTFAFFEELGIVPKVEKEGKAYPLSEQASSIVDVLLYELNHLGVEIIADALVCSVIKKTRHFEIYLEDGRTVEADKVIIATGGKAMPKSGSDGSGYDLAADLGHKIEHVFPTIVKLKLDSPHLKHLEGIKMPTRVKLISDGQVIQTEEDDIIFGNYGISGPAILNLSRKANELLLEGKNAYVRLNLVTALDNNQVASRFDKLKDKPVNSSLIGLINKRYISAILKEANIQKQDTPVKNLSVKQLNVLTNLLFEWDFPVKGSKSFHDAQATAGGVSLKEIDDKTMQSKRIDGLYFTGEVIDIDGRCGGFNLQWAWASGYLAGYHASKGEIYAQN